MGPLARRLFGHVRPTGACNDRTRLTRPTGRFKGTPKGPAVRRVRPGEWNPAVWLSVDELHDVDHHCPLGVKPGRSATRETSATTRPGAATRCNWRGWQCSSGENFGRATRETSGVVTLHVLTSGTLHRSVRSGALHRLTSRPGVDAA